MRSGGIDRTGLHQVVEIPRSAAASTLRDPFGPQRTAALVSAFHGGRRDAKPLVWAWVRAARNGPISLLTTDPSILPGGSTHSPAGPEAIPNGLTWLSIECPYDGIIQRGNESKRHEFDAGQDHRPSIESCLLPVWKNAFALVITAAPVGPEDAADVVQTAAAGARRAKQRADSSPDRAVEHERLKAWHRDLCEGESAGLWRVEISVGAENRADAREVGALVMASLDPGQTGYTLVPGSQSTIGSLATTNVLSILTKPPATEVPGIRLALKSEFDTTPESNGGKVVLGGMMDRDRRPAGPLRLDLESLNRHTFVCGATGSGKSQTTRHLLEEVTKQGIPWLVVEPAKAEYRSMATRLPGHDVIVIRPGDPEQIACGIDPMMPAEGFPLQTHIDLTRALFLAAFEADEPFPQVLAAALTRAYEQQGWNIALSEPIDSRYRPRYPTLTDLEACAQEVIREVGYGPEVAANIRGFVKVRLSSLRLGTTGRFLEGGYPIDIQRLLESNVVLEIEDVGDDHDKAFIMGAVLIALTEHHRVRERRGDPARGRLRHVTVFEEAHRLLRRTEKSGAAAEAVEMFAALLAEVRAYGEGLVIAEQIPAKLIPDVIKNTAVKVVHRLPAKDDRDAVGATMNLSDAQSAYLVTVPPGVAGVFADGMDSPILAVMPDGTERETTEAGASASPASVVRSTFGRCQTETGSRHLTLAAAARGRRRVERYPLVRWWGELAVLGHVVGRPPPFPVGELLPAFDDITGFELDGMVTHVVDEAVASRSCVIRNRMSPAALAEHVKDVMMDMLYGGDGCVYAEPRWLAEPFRWEQVWDELEMHIEKDPPGGCSRPHPLTEPSWVRQYGVVIPGDDCLAQREVVREWRRQARAHRTVEDVRFGIHPYSALEQAVKITRVEDAWEPIVVRMVETLKAQWAKPHLLAPLFYDRKALKR